MSVVVPPATHDAWSFSGGDFYVEVTGNNRHRRATVPELKAQFETHDSSRDRPGHWYEAQLIHYGLPPSKTKGTAKMRLFEAVNKGNLAVPSQIKKVESELKKEWTKRDRDIKQALKQPTTAPPPTKRGTKRKADDAAPSPVNIINIINSGNLNFAHGNIQTSSPGPAPKKAKTAAKATTTGKGAAKKTAEKAKAPLKPKAATSKTNKKAKQEPTTKKTPAPKTAVPKAAVSSPVSRLARRSGPPPRAREHAPNSDDDLPPPYPGSPVSYGLISQDQIGHALPPLGLLNGRYQLRCIVARGYEHLGNDNSSLILTLDGNSLWGKFEIGPLTGMLRLDERPYQSSTDPLFFTWQGEDEQYGDHDGVNDGSFIKFIGDGEVYGQIEFYDTTLDFEGRRISGQNTRSEINAATMRDMWVRRVYH